MSLTYPIVSPTSKYTLLGPRNTSLKTSFSLASTAAACGQGSAQMGPFYCSGDQKLYIDLSFFTTMKQQLGADGDVSQGNTFECSDAEL